MFKNYFKTALRNLQRNMSSAFINIAGLVVGFAAFLLIFLVVQYENSFDNFHTNKDQVYRIVRVGRNAENREYRPGVPFPVTQGLRNDIPQLKNVSAIFGDNNVPIVIPAADGSVKKKFNEPHVFSADPQFFKMFNFGLAVGNIQTALNDVNTVLLTKDVAVKYFDNWQQAVGKSIKLYGNLMKVTGILNNPPANTDFPLTVVVSYATLMHYNDPNDWGSISDLNYCFIQLDKNTSPAKLAILINNFTEKHIKPVNPGYTLELEPLNEIHFDARYGNFNGVTFSKTLVLGLSIIGLFLLVIACVNFINITTAQAVNRAREVGVRKVLGGSRTQLIGQFLGETGLTTLFALIASLIVVFTCLPFVNNLLDVHITSGELFHSNFIVFIVTAFLVVTFLSGFYPALVLSGFKSVKVLKGSLLKNSQGISLRRALVVFQFVIAQALIIGTLIVASQMNYFKNADLGFNKDAVITAGFPGDSLSKTKIDFLHNELVKINGVQNVSFSSFAPTNNGGWYTDLRKTTNHSKEPDMVISMKPADTAFFRLYNLQLLAGRVYFPSDTMHEIIVNETVIKKLGFHDAAKAVGTMVNVNGATLPIVGVVKNFHNGSLRDEIGCIVLTSFKNAYGLANIKIDMRQSKQVIASLQKTWNKYYPDYVFEYNFLDQSIADYYKQENQLAALYKIFAGIAIFISCLGLYGLVAFMAIQRKKEIGIRKVLGAPVSDIVIMLSKEFTLLIAIAFLIAAPFAWYFMHQWLQQYAFRISIGAGFFIATICCSLIIAWITVGYTAIKAAIANPVKSLRTE
jgi:ABC-type antimicrobial peptide transport system permease subunit